MTINSTICLLLALGYLLGSIPFGKLVGRLRGIDIQKVGSGNIGFANALRTMGWRPALLVLAGDALKGFVPVLLAVQYAGVGWAMAVGVAAIAGHVFPVWLKGRGGKGIATGLGITLALNPLLAVLALCVYMAVVVVMRRSAPASLLSAWSLPLLCLAVAPRLAWFYVGLATLALWTHRANLRAMKKGWSYAVSRD
jgi:glycerol-3-phosphate acyltransferase PlsY